jgi:divalent metal cation (Fe/Co/Zn/Cd) transporter
MKQRFIRETHASMTGLPSITENRAIELRSALTRQAFRLEWLTIAWMIVEGVVAVGAGIAVGSLTLTAFGLDSVIELASACVLIWRLNVELRRGQAFSERAERTASKFGGGLLFALAAYIIAGAVWSFFDATRGGVFSTGADSRVAGDSHHHHAGTT